MSARMVGVTRIVPWRWLGFPVAALTLSACSEAVDVNVANPCPVAITARIYVDDGTKSKPESVASMRRDDPEAQRRVPTGRVVEVGSVISGPGEYRYALIVGAAVVRFDEADLERSQNTVVLPKSACDAV